MKQKVEDDILDEKTYPVIGTLSLHFLELIIITFTLVSIFFVFAPIAFTILVTTSTDSTKGDKIGLVFLLLISILKLIPFSFVVLFFKASNNNYLDKKKAFKPSYFANLQQYSIYIGLLYLILGALMSFLYGFSDYRTLYTLSIFFTGIAILIYTNKTGEYIQAK